MAQEITQVPLQTLYAELEERLVIGELQGLDGPAPGSFQLRHIGNQSYWYHRQKTESGSWRWRYVGRNTPELQSRIEKTKAIADAADRRAELVRALKAAGMPAPDGLTGRILHALAKQGVFRLRGVLVGTVAFQTYPAMLGFRPSSSSLARTADLDIAQFEQISIAIAVDEAVERPLLETLQSVDPKFQAPMRLDQRPATWYVLGPDGYRVDVLVPNRGPDDDAPTALPALKTHGGRIRFLDFLIRDEMKAAVLHGPGVLINVPRPERFAVHKLIVASERRKRPVGAAKAPKDAGQAASLAEILMDLRPYELREALAEAWRRGPRWREALADGAAFAAALGRPFPLPMPTEPASIVEIDDDLAPGL